MDRAQSELTQEKNLISRREVLKTGIKLGVAAAVTGGFVGCGGTSRESEQKLITPKSELTKTEIVDIPAFRRDVEGLSFEDLDNSETLSKFVHDASNVYMQFSNSSRVNSEKLKRQTNIFKTTDEFVSSIKMEYPEYEATNSKWGYTDFASGKVFIDLENMKTQSLGDLEYGGKALVDGLWHEWGHLDVEERHYGELLNNRDVGFFSPVSNQGEMWKKYRGGSVYTETYFGMLRFEEVLNETLNVRRMVDDLGLDNLIAAGDYYYNGVDFFPTLTYILGITGDELYNYHGTSDFEGLANRIGQELPGDQDALIKGLNLFIGIHNGDSRMIEDSGVFTLFS